MLGKNARKDRLIMNFYTYPIETRKRLEAIAHNIAFNILRGDVALIKAYIAHVRTLPHGALVETVLALIEDMSNGD